MARKKSKKITDGREIKVRSMVVLGMLLTRKGGPMKDRRTPRSGARNRQGDFLSGNY